MGDLVKAIKRERDGMVQRVQLAAEEVAEGARDFAPFGHSGQLRAGIDTLKPIQVKGKIKGIIISSAISEDGYDYAEIQHDAILRHASPSSGKATMSFKDAGITGDDSQERYESGYKIKKDGAPMYSNPYLNRGYLDRVAEIKQILGDFSEGGLARVKSGKAKK